MIEASYAALVQEHWQAVLAPPPKKGLCAGILLQMGFISLFVVSVVDSYVVMEVRHSWLLLVRLR